VLTPPAAEVGAPISSAKARGATMPIAARATIAAIAQLVRIWVVISRILAML
jgi:hypothetical protein